MKYGFYYQIAHKETNEVISFEGETKFYSLDKAQESMSAFEYQDTLNNERMMKELHSAAKFQLDIEFTDDIFSHYRNLPKSKDYQIIQRSGFLFGDES